ncbi:MAG: hypothetical protein K2J80_07895 [Oscillospiraceae bacterium]|nr:hypothetical protein [Oscillospiraceae bacterium]
MASVTMFCAARCNSETNPDGISITTQSSSSFGENFTDRNQSQNTQQSDDGVHNTESSEPVSAENKLSIPSNTTSEEVSEPMITSDPYTRSTRISEAINAPVFGNYGRLIFPPNDGYYSGETRGDLTLTWYNNIDSDKTVEIANYMRSHAEDGDVIFYDIYSDSEEAADPRKKETKWFFFKENPGENSRFAMRAADSRMYGYIFMFFMREENFKREGRHMEYKNNLNAAYAGLFSSFFRLFLSICCKWIIAV